MAASPRAVPSRRAWTIVALLFLFMMINFMDKAVLGLAGSEIKEDLGLSDTRFGSIGSAFFLLFSVAGVAVGFLADRVTAKRLLTWMVVVWSLSQLVIGLPMAGFVTLLVTRVTLGAAEGPANPIAMHAAFSWFPDSKRTLPSSVVNVGASTGIVVGAPILAAVIGSLGWRAAFILTGGLGVLWALVWHAVGGEGPFSRKAAAEQGEAGAEERVPYARLLTRGTFLAGLAAGFAAYWTMACAVVWLPQFLERVHRMELDTASLLVAATQVVGIGFMLGAGYGSQRLLAAGRSTRTARGVLGGALVMLGGLGTLAVTRVGGGAALVLVMMVAFTAGNAFFGLMQTLMAELAPLRQRAAAMSVVTALAASAGAIGPLVTGALVDSAGSAADGFQNAYDLGGLLMIAGGLLAVVLVRPARDRASLLAAGPTDTPMARAR